MLRRSASHSYAPDVAADHLSQLRTAVAIVDRTFCFVYANPAFVELARASGWRGAPLKIIGEAEPVVAELIERTREVNVPIVSRSVDVMFSGTLCRVDMSASVLDGGDVLVEIHPLGTRLEDGAVPRVSQSLRGLAHEMKNPLAGLRGAAQLLKRGTGDPDQQLLADLVISEADRLGALADRLLHPLGKTAMRAVNPHEVTERARALIVAEAGADIALKRDYDPSLPEVNGAPDSLLQVLLNLMRNALQAGAKTITVRTRAEPGAVVGGQPLKRALRIDVIDDGHGVPDEIRESLFMPLVSGHTDGTGLGLALAQEIAHEHGGQIVFRSRPGHTVFSLILPTELRDV
ncbi:MAG TPA: ATP-binding protein [Rudaea sp.]|jgi:two-component system nitrogen regulation sensor histidine kinase GlnL|nr:ATP-binding protein [Rudaea sp.]